MRQNRSPCLRNNENVNNIHKQKKAPLCILLFSLIYTKLNKITGF